MVEVGPLTSDLEEMLKLGLAIVEGGGGGDVDVAGSKWGEESVGECWRKKRGVREEERHVWVKKGCGWNFILHLRTWV